jgi:hypothetical protein
MDKLKMHVNLIPEDITKGKRGEETSCAIARCVKREGGMVMQKPLKEVHVNRDGIDIVLPNGVELHADIPKKAIDFIQDFDEKRPVKPIAFVANFKKKEKETSSDW